MMIKNFFQKLTLDYRNSAFLKRVLVSFIIISSICIILLSSAFLFKVNTYYAETLSSLQENMLTQAYNVNDTTLKDIISYGYYLLDDSAITSILYTESESSTAASIAIKACKDLHQISSLIKSVYLINFNTHIITDQSGMRLSIDFYHDQEIFAIFQDMIPSQTPLFFYPRSMPENLLIDTASQTPILTIIFYPNKNGAIVVNIDYNTYVNMLSPQDNKNVDIIMINSMEQVMFASDPALFGVDYSHDKVYQEVKSSRNNRGDFTYTLDNNKHILVKYIQNCGFGITYICRMNKMFFYPDNLLFSSLVRYIIPCVAIALFLSLVISHLIYNPLRKFKSYIENTATNFSAEISRDRDEFRYLTQTYQALLDNNAHLQHIGMLHKKEKQQKLFKALLVNSPDVFVQNSAELEALNATFSHKTMTVLTIGLDPDSQKGETPNSIDLLTFVIYNVTEELLSSTFTVQHLDSTAPYVTFLVGSDELDIGMMTKILRNSQSFILEHFNITFSAGIGESIEDIAELSLSYNSACTALSHRFITGNSSINAINAVNKLPIADQLYPYKAGEALLTALKSMSIAEVSKYLQEFFTAISSYNIENSLLYILQLCTSLQQLEYNFCITAEGDWNYKALEQSTLAIIEQKLTERCINDIEQIKKSRETSSVKKELIDMIINAVNENIFNPNLSVTFLANQIHLSVNYLRSIFKESTGESLANYITQKKLNLIYDLLVNSDLSLSDISDKLGFSNKNYFFTFFKKHTGMTPSEYRKNKSPRNPEADAIE